MRGQFDPDATAEAREKIRQQRNEKYAAILTEEQKGKWSEMLGTPASDELLAQIRSATAFRGGGGGRRGPEFGPRPETASHSLR